MEIEAITSDQIAEFKRTGKWGGVFVGEDVSSAPLAVAPVSEKPLDVLPVDMAESSDTKQLAELGKGLFLQIGAFRNKENATGLKSRLISSNEFASDLVNVVSKEGMFRIHVGPYESEQAARVAALQLRDKQGVNVVLVR